MVRLLALPRSERLSFRRLPAGMLVWTADSKMGPIYEVKGPMTNEQAASDPYLQFCKNGRIN